MIETKGIRLGLNLPATKFSFETGVVTLQRSSLLKSGFHAHRTPSSTGRCSDQKGRRGRHKAMTALLHAISRTQVPCIQILLTLAQLLPTRNKIPLLPRASSRLTKVEIRAAAPQVLQQHCISL
jgi:hypothetical protein